MVPAYEEHQDSTKPELDSSGQRVKPELADTSHIVTKPGVESPSLPAKSELDGVPRNVSVQPPEYDRQHAERDKESHELPAVDSIVMQQDELRKEHASLADVGPAIVIPATYLEEDNRLEQLRAQRAIVVRDRERKEEIERMRAEEERLGRAIAELESRRP